MKRKVVPFILSTAIVASSIALTPITLVNANDNTDVYEDSYDDDEVDADVEEIEEDLEEETEEVTEAIDEETEEIEEVETEEEEEAEEETEEAVLIYAVTDEIAINIDGNQGEIQLEYTLEDLKENTLLTLNVSEFTNEMDSINVAVRVDDEVVAVGLELTENEEITFELPEDYIGRTITVTTSTNSENSGQARLQISN